MYKELKISSYDKLIALLYYSIFKQPVLKRKKESLKLGRKLKPKEKKKKEKKKKEKTIEKEEDKIIIYLSISLYVYNDFNCYLGVYLTDTHFLKK